MADTNESTDLTVKGLIEILKTMPPDAKILVPGQDDGGDRVHRPDGVSLLTAQPNIPEEFWLGDFHLGQDEYNDSDCVQAVVIGTRTLPYEGR